MDESLAKQSTPEETRVMASVIYAFYLLGVLIPVTPILGVVFAHVAKSKSRSIMLRTHYKYQVGVFWSALGMCILSIIPVIFLEEIGLLAAIAVMLWFIYKSIVGLVSLNAVRQMDD